MDTEDEVANEIFKHGVRATKAQKGLKFTSESNNLQLNTSKKSTELELQSLAILYHLS